jgi:virulence-associated protein VagC
LTIRAGTKSGERGVRDSAIWRVREVWYILVYITYFSEDLSMADSEERSEPGVRAKLFWNGRSQAVRLPKEFRFEGDEVEIRREGNAVILEPVRRREWPKGFFEDLRAHAHLFEDLEVPPPLPPGGTEVDFDEE